MEAFGEKVLAFHMGLQIPKIPLPEGFEWLFPYDGAETKE